MTHVVVVGGGNAGLCAAIAAREAGATVHLIERAPRDLRGGNSAFTAGLMRTVYNGVDDVRDLVDSLTDDDLRNAEFGSYSSSRLSGHSGQDHRIPLRSRPCREADR